MRTYLALGDSMSIDDYTGVAGGGAVAQFFRRLGKNWRVDDRTCDGCRMHDVPLDGRGDLITLTIGGNDLLCNQEKYLREGVGEFESEHLALLGHIRQTNPDALLIVGDVYEPDLPLSDAEQRGLTAANAVIRTNCQRVGAHLAPIHDAFQGHASDYLCLGIEPTLKGATVIAELFEEIYRQQAAPGITD